jgi:hypothetical protein
MKAIAHLTIPAVCAFAFLLWSLMLFQANQLVEGLLIGSLILAFVLSWLVVRAVPISGFRLSVASSVGFFLLWSLLWATATEGYIFFCVAEGSTESGIGKSRYIYPGHSGMGYADGLVNYAKIIPAILLYSTVVGFISGIVLCVIRIICTNAKRAEQAVGGNGGQAL